MQIFFILYVLTIIAVGIYVLVLLTRFVRAHERAAEALELVARRFRDPDKG